MKKTIFSFIVIFVAGSLHAQTGNYSGRNPYDSILFDGGSEIISGGLCDSSDCIIKITPIVSSVLMAAL